MDKTPKTKLKELKDKYKGVGAELLVFDSTVYGTDPKPTEFEFTCVFTKSKHGHKFEGCGIGKSKKSAEQAACQRVLDLLQTQLDDFHPTLTPANARSPEVSRPLSSLVLVPNQVSPSHANQPNLFNDGATYVIQSNPRPHHSRESNPQMTTVAPDDLQLDSSEMLQRATANNSIGELQEFCVKGKLILPEYKDVLHWTGPDNSNRFKVQCTVGAVIKFGIATVKKSAKQIAAFKVLETTRSLSSSPAITVTAATTTAPIPDIVLGRVANYQGPADPTRPCKNVTGKIKYYEDTELGKGATAKVFEGCFENRKAAVKICRKEIAYHEKNEELEIMRQLNDPNVVTYYITEDVGDLTYIVMELAICTLENVMKNNTISEPLPLQKWSTDMTNGLVALHNQKIVHRDIKPSNVLIFSGDVAKLSDFGISRGGVSTEGVVTDAGRGTRIFMPTESLKALAPSSSPFRLLKSFDIFSLGLTIFYTMTEGKHLFAFKKDEVPLQIQYNIFKYRPNWKWLAGIEWTSLKNLLQAMIHIEPMQRPETCVVLEHPFFWDEKKSLDFVVAVNNDFKNNPSPKVVGDCKSAMMSMYDRFCSENKYGELKNWKNRLCPDVQNFMSYKDEMKKTKQNYSQTKKYAETSFLKLIEFIRDYTQHNEDWRLFQNGKLLQDNIFGYDGSKYATYFFSRFPELTTFLYAFFQEGQTGVFQISQFYKLNKTECFPKW